MKPGTRVLVIEDDHSIAQLLEIELEERDLEVRCCHDGISGLEAVSAFGPAGVVLDIRLPGMDGVGVLKRIRQRGTRVPVIMLTARGASPDKVHSLDSGADDYVEKPFDMEELLARLRALVRRAEGDEEILRVANLEINTATREVRRGTRKVALTAREYELLRFMAQNPRRVLSRGLLLSRVWGYGSNVGTANVVEVYMAYLRKKVDAPQEPRLIHTIRGAGYALREE